MQSNLGARNARWAACVGVAESRKLLENKARRRIILIAWYERSGGDAGATCDDAGAINDNRGFWKICFQPNWDLLFFYDSHCSFNAVCHNMLLQPYNCTWTKHDEQIGFYRTTISEFVYFYDWYGRFEFLSRVVYHIKIGTYRILYHIFYNAYNYYYLLILFINGI